MNPMTIMVRMPNMNKYVGTAKILPASRTPGGRLFASSEPEEDEGRPPAAIQEQGLGEGVVVELHSRVGQPQAGVLDVLHVPDDHVVRELRMEEETDDRAQGRIRGQRPFPAPLARWEIRSFRSTPTPG